jgi:hypothetical protein
MKQASRRVKYLERGQLKGREGDNIRIDFIDINYEDWSGLEPYLMMGSGICVVEILLFSKYN